MGDERRIYDRQPLSNQLISGSFLLTCMGQGIEFNSVEDISVSGVGVIISKRLENGTEVELAYQQDNHTIRTRGHVAWVVDANDGYRTGIHFDPVYMNDNVNFFMCMREFVNELGAGF